MEAMEAAGRDMGLDAETAHLLTLQTALGAARMAMEASAEPAELRRNVTSPGGTTERALEVLEEGGLRALFTAALGAARDRSDELSRVLGGQ
jgi:pyrroline-5-carboxylate reductase